MGRKKQKKRGQNVMDAAVDAKGGENDKQDAAKGAAPCGTSAEKDVNNPCEDNLIDDQIEQSSTQSSSSWFSEVRWVSRHDHELKQTTVLKAEASSLLPTDVSLKFVANHLPKETEITKLPPSILAESKSPPERAHALLLSELNQIKQQLMPAANACADAINEYRCEKSTSASYEFRQARSICNPFECLGETFSKNHSNRHKKKSSKRNYQQHSSSGLSQFVNRSAIKLANIDALLGFSLTNKTQQEQQQNATKEPKFIFVDLCGAPGGFSEYILYRHVNPASVHDYHQCSGKPDSNEHKMNCMEVCYGFGMSLFGSNDDGKGARWDLDHLKQYHLHSKDTLETRNNNMNQNLCYHVCNGADETGSIYNFENVLQLQRELSMTVQGKGDTATSRKSLANLVVADGGFDAQRDSNNQESIAHKIIVSQTVAALTLLCPGGTFVLKMFGFQEKGTRSMLRYLYNCFDQMTFVKPILSRPASAERYLVCRGYTGPGTEWDGFIWREQMMVSPAISHEKKAGAQTYTPLDDLMDAFDLDMMQLNVDTCRSIINFLNDKRESVEQGEGTYAYKKQKNSLDIKSYEATWQLI
mmetsp:Transcript_26345/g.56561  ORF Transcript_26345/g.56561 Transcript_26345/m.56561 type:complete len:586 (+) Transcript_26345:176-1933(+)